MIKYFFITALLFKGLVSVAHAQNPLDKVKAPIPSAATNARFNVKSIASGIMSKQGPSLALSAIQKPKVLSTVTDFLNKKSGILGLAKSYKAQYADKLACLNTGLRDKMKGILTASLYTQFLGLKTKAPSPTNPLSQLFF